ncbi:hypothetical protein EDB86DRAFT_1470443 [Lactarius hatsudake]|nr:hypothetical protein EDB86DRAFT_1470443 [Lactarius hatsudake]
MTIYTTLPLEAHENMSLFFERARNIGRAYRNQALELISICQHLSRIASPRFAHEDAELKRIFRVCDIALRSAANSGTNVTDEANTRFKEATQLLSTLNSDSERVHHLALRLTVNARMEIAERKDSVERERSHVEFEEELERGPTINFVLLQSPLPAPRHPDSVISGSVSFRPFEKSFGTSAVMMTVHVSPSSRTPTSICVSLEMKGHIHLHFGGTHFKT